MKSAVLGSSDVRLKQTRIVANSLIYASIVVGVALLAQLYSIVPLWLFLSVLAGWISYLIVGIAVTMQVNVAYPVSLVLATLTLLVSLPQPEHYSIDASVASATFIAGSVLQIAVILSVARYLVLKRNS